MTSARRWQNMGIVRTTLINQLIVCGYGLGIPPAILPNGIDECAESVNLTGEVNWTTIIL